MRDAGDDEVAAVAELLSRAAGGLDSSFFEHDEQRIRAVASDVRQIGRDCIEVSAVLDSAGPNN